MDVNKLVDTLNNLDPENIGGWPLPIKAFIWLVATVACGFLVYNFKLSESIVMLEVEEGKESGLIQDYERKAFKASNLEDYKLQMEQMEVTFGSLLRQLPTDTEVPGLLEDISHTGLSAGLEFKSIQLGAEVAQEFYVELPISIEVRGGYHSLGTFVSGVSALPRIVTLHDFTVESGESKNANDLTMSITAKTYRYNEPE